MCVVLSLFAGMRDVIEAQWGTLVICYRELDTRRCCDDETAFAEGQAEGERERPTD